jgi:hypothetical protein
VSADQTHLREAHDRDEHHDHAFEWQDAARIAFAARPDSGSRQSRRRKEVSATTTRAAPQTGAELLVKSLEA